MSGSHRERGLPAGRRGVTLIELLVVVAIMTSLFAIGVVMSMTAFHNFSRRSERDVLVSMMQRARSRSMANVKEVKWGVCYDGTSYWLFGGSYPGTLPKDSIEKNTGVTLVAPSAFDCVPGGGIMFDQLSGKATAATITVTQGPDTSTIAINSEGTIVW